MSRVVVLVLTIGLGLMVVALMAPEPQLPAPKAEVIEAPRTPLQPPNSCPDSDGTQAMYLVRGCCLGYAPSCRNLQHRATGDLTTSERKPVPRPDEPPEPCPAAHTCADEADQKCIASQAAALCCRRHRPSCGMLLKMWGDRLAEREAALDGGTP